MVARSVGNSIQMRRPLATANVRFELDNVKVRQQAVAVAAAMGFDQRDQERIAAAVSEITRNAFDYGRSARVEFALDLQPYIALRITLRDEGPGIENLEAILSGSFRSRRRIGVGIRGARALMDDFSVQTQVGCGTTVTMSKRLLAPVSASAESITRKVGAALADLELEDPLDDPFDQRSPRIDDPTGLPARLPSLAEKNVALDEETGRSAETRERIMAALSHDMKSPLCAIGLAASLIGETAESEQQRKNSATIQRATNRLERMIQDLSDFAELQAGKLQLEMGSIEIGRLLVEVATLHQAAAENLDISFEIERPEAELLVLADRERILQVLNHLVRNSLKICPAGSTIHLEVTARASEAIVTVRDDGPGIPANVRANLFRPYRSAEQDRRGGTGLGLPIAQELVQAHGGRIWADSHQPGGAVIRFSLQRA